MHYDDLGMVIGYKAGWDAATAKALSTLGWRAFNLEMDQRTAYPWPMDDPLPCIEANDLLEAMEDIQPGSTSSDTQ